MLSHVHLVETISHSLYYSTGKLCRFLFFLITSLVSSCLCCCCPIPHHKNVVTYLPKYLYYDAGTYNSYKKYFSPKILPVPAMALVSTDCC